MNDHIAAGSAAEAGSADGTMPPVPREMPPVPTEIRKAGRLAPDPWLGMVDPAWQGEDEPPHWAVVGQWRSGSAGEIEEWRPNEEYRPSPQPLGRPAPSDPVDEAVQRAATGNPVPAAHPAHPAHPAYPQRWSFLP